ncbi:CGNR zinc finger domain-containing protein [Streptomyces sp. NRRL S-340]|uniref:CGNR zinc finger domain-containing protein n=1 Tax=Streptomyces sp. NRRL S-340 TaxID=1463901 RepID=UPI00099CDD0D|nr:ABATE domain-containing protein [Streptomyces sp. NRRL S-340]
MKHVFLCGTPALDFLGTLQARHAPVPVERIGTPRLLDSWLVESGLLDEAPGSGESDLRAAVGLREGIYELVTARRTGEPFPPAAMTAVNRQAAKSPVSVRLGAHGTSRTGSAAQALTDLARETVSLLASAEAVLLRECARPGCTQVYLDRSRGHRREWCAMRTCGNRVKSAALRARRRQ